MPVESAIARSVYLAATLVACGGVTTSVDDAGDASPVEAAMSEDASFDVAVSDGDAKLGPNCVIGDASYGCKPGSSWTWGDAGAECFDRPCPSGSACVLNGIEAGAGVCE